MKQLRNTNSIQVFDKNHTLFIYIFEDYLIFKIDSRYIQDMSNISTITISSNIFQIVVKNINRIFVSFLEVSYNFSYKTFDRIFNNIFIQVLYRVLLRIIHKSYNYSKDYQILRVLFKVSADPYKIAVHNKIIDISSKISHVEVY
jgi:hypothetical protein